MIPTAACTAPSHAHTCIIFLLQCSNGLLAPFLCVMVIDHDTSFSLSCTFLFIHTPLTFFPPSYVPFPSSHLFGCSSLILSRRECVGTRCMRDRRHWKRQIYCAVLVYLRSDVYTYMFVFDVCFFLE